MVIKESCKNDLAHIQSLWSDGDVMKYVGFPNGLNKNDEDMIKWLCWIEKSRPAINHYSIYDEGRYCGETFYNIDKSTKRAALDIKLFSFAREKGIAFRALKFAIGEAFKNGAKCCYVDPNPQNEKAINLYKRIGMVQKQIPNDLDDTNYPGFLYFEIEKDSILQNKE